MHEMDKPKYIAKGADQVWCDLEKFMNIFLHAMLSIVKLIRDLKKANNIFKGIYLRDIRDILEILGLS